MDVFPTVLEAAGIQPPHPIQGRSLAPLLQAGAAPRPILAELDADSHPRFRAFQRSLRMILKDDDKLIEASNQKHEMFDLNADAAELSNLIELDAGRAQRLRTEMNDHFRLFQTMRHQGTGEMDPETREKLKALGYIE
jgi:arylsulfatase A-like enzyme